MRSPGEVRRAVLEAVDADSGGMVVCFDLFDTLLTRAVMPEYTKRIAARQLSRILVQQRSQEELYALRHMLEAAVCAENQKRGYDLEFQLSDLAGRLYDLLQDQGISFPGALERAAFVALTLDLEVAVERRVLKPCPDMITLLQEVKEKGCATILISDFYLPQAQVRLLLKEQGLDQLLDHCFISCESLLTKGSGRLYSRISKELALNPERMLMIGDNPHADYQMARETGLRAFLLDRRDHYQVYRHWEADQKNPSALPGALRSAATRRGPSCFPEITLTLWYFIELLFDQLMRDQVETIFFLSREGEFLLKLFRRYQEQFFGRQVIKSHYLLASRKSTYVASLRPLGEEDFYHLFRQYQDIAARDFLLSLNFTEAECKEICDAAGVDAQMRHGAFPQTEEFRRIVASTLFSSRYEQLRQGQRENFRLYLKSFGVNLEKDDLHLVDVGWKGSIQENIFRILGEGIRVAGYYVGLLASTVSHPLLVKSGILFAEFRTCDPFFPVYNNNRSLFEMILGASHGSAEGYFRSETEVAGRDQSQIHSRRLMADGGGEILVAVAEDPEENRLFATTMQPMQAQIYDAFEAIISCFLNTQHSRPAPDWFAGQHGRMVFLPRKREVDFFSSLYHLENFGVFEFTTFQSGQMVSLARRLANLKAVMTDPALLEIGFWPPVILNHLGVGPYRHIDGIRRYRRIFGRKRLLCALASC